MGVRKTETALIVWSATKGSVADQPTAAAAETPPLPADASLLGADFFYDAGSKGCGEGPLDEIAGKLRKMDAGQTLEVRATDPSVVVDLPAWCRMTGHQLIEQQGDRYLIRRK